MEKCYVFFEVRTECSASKGYLHGDLLTRFDVYVAIGKVKAVYVVHGIYGCA